MNMYIYIKCYLIFTDDFFLFYFNLIHMILKSQIGLIISHEDMLTQSNPDNFVVISRHVSVFVEGAHFIRCYRVVVK